jgi:hypothetical protein
MERFSVEVNGEYGALPRRPMIAGASILPRRPPRSTVRETTIAATVVADMPQYLERHGISPAEAIRECRIDVRFAAEADDRVAGSHVERLWDFSVQ